jgi:hypothetical protein
MGCFQGEPALSACQWYNKGLDDIAESSVASDDDNRVVPWSGDGMGLDDLSIISARRRPIMIGIVGSTDAGKTTFLAALYCLIRNGHFINGCEFAGSRTLVGWENIAWGISLKDPGYVKFPAHTSINSGRIPSLLHLALRRGSELIDVLFTDAPGEWFDNWSINKNDPNAEGADWIAKRADAFILFADSKNLSGLSLGTTRQKLLSLSTRLRDALDERPLVLSWSKSDEQVEKIVRTKVQQHVFRGLKSPIFESEISLNPGENRIWHHNILSSVEWILQVLKERRMTPITIASTEAQDLFISKRW